jgi:hypothetical protein
VDSVDTLTKVLFGELTHTNPYPFINDTVTWNFLYTAPDSIVTDTLYSVANSVNGDSIPTNLDQWNFGENFVVNVIDQPVNIDNELLIPERFVLYQNYPNPFNPVTKIKFTVPAILNGVEGTSVTLKVYDVLGNEVATLLNRKLSAGNYEIKFSANKLTSGIYFYALQSGSLVQTKKMVLLK